MRFCAITEGGAYFQPFPRGSPGPLELLFRELGRVAAGGKIPFCGQICLTSPDHLGIIILGCTWDFIACQQ